jgi:hypothetical protein
MKEYVTVPDALLRNTRELQKYLALSYAYAKTLKPKQQRRNTKLRTRLNATHQYLNVEGLRRVEPFAYNSDGCRVRRSHWERRILGLRWGGFEPPTFGL